MNKWAALLVMMLAGCSVPEGGQSERFVPARPVIDIFTDTIVGTVEGAWIAVQTPFEDVGFKKQPIPEKLQQIADDPYAMPAQMLCDGIRKEIAELDMLLGPDVCTTTYPTGFGNSRKGEYVEKGAGMAREQAIGMVSSKANIIPFRGVVRRVSGADKHAREVERAYQAGKLRRAFLKGLASGLGPTCLTPSPDLSQVEPK
jgi:hypothetical protein